MMQVVDLHKGTSVAHSDLHALAWAVQFQGIAAVQLHLVMLQMSCVKCSQLLSLTY